MKKMDAYNEYILDWMKQHGYTLTDVIRAVYEHTKELNAVIINEADILYGYADWFVHGSFEHGEMWASYDEWKMNEGAEYDDEEIDN